jgi:hypothetical protein
LSQGYSVNCLEEEKSKEGSCRLEHSCEDTAEEEAYKFAELLESSGLGYVRAHTG